MPLPIFEDTAVAAPDFESLKPEDSESQTRKALKESNPFAVQQFPELFAAETARPSLDPVPDFPSLKAEPPKLPYRFQRTFTGPAGEEIGPTEREHVPILNEQQRKISWLKFQYKEQDKPDEDFIREHPELKFSIYGLMSPTDMPMARLSKDDAALLVGKTMAPVVAGGQQAIADLADFFTSAPGVMTIMTGGAAGAGAAPTAGVAAIGPTETVVANVAERQLLGHAMNKATAYGFAADMAYHMPEQANAALDAIQRGDATEAIRIATGAAVSLAVIGGAAKMAVTPESPMSVVAEQIKPLAPLTAEALRETQPKEANALQRSASEVIPTVQAQPVEGAEKVPVAPRTEPDVAAREESPAPQTEIASTPSATRGEPASGQPAEPPVGEPAPKPPISEAQEFQSLSENKSRTPEQEARFQELKAKSVAANRAAAEQLKSELEARKKAEGEKSKEGGNLPSSSDRTIASGQQAKQKTGVAQVPAGENFNPEFADIHAAARKAARSDVFSSMSPTSREHTTPPPGQPHSEIRKQWDLAYNDEWQKASSEKSELLKGAESPIPKQEPKTIDQLNEELGNLRHSRYRLVKALPPGTIGWSGFESTKARVDVLDKQISAIESEIRNHPETLKKAEQEVADWEAKKKAWAEKRDAAVKAAPVFQRRNGWQIVKESGQYVLRDPVTGEDVYRSSQLKRVREVADESKPEAPAPPPKPVPNQLTPMMQQYQRIKTKLTEQGHGDALLAFRLGDFYEFFFDDAKQAASIAKISLTKRNNVDMAGVPYHAAKQYFDKIIASGRRVAVVDALEKPEPGKLVERDITEILGDKTAESKPPLSEGPGAASPTDIGKKAQIEQLSSAFKGIASEKVPLREKIRRAFDLGHQKAMTQDLIGRALSALKTSGDYIINTWKGVKDVDPVLKVKGELSAQLELRGWRMRQAMKEMKLAIPDIKVREAISKYVDAGGDEATLRDSLAKAPAAKKAAYERALSLTKDEKLAAEHIKAYFESRLQEAIDAGVLDEGVSDYIHRIYPRESKWKTGIINAIQNGILNTRKPGLAMRRVFEMDAEAEAAGYNPVGDFIPRILDYEQSLSKVIASRAAVKAFTDIKMPDGRPMLDVAGMGAPIEGKSGAREATLINPSFKPGEAQFDENGKPTKNYRKDYQARDYPALKRWKWATKDEAGNPIFVQGDVLIHPDAVHRVDALLEPSKLRKYGAIRGALAVSGTAKQTMLDLSGFHQVQITAHGLEHKVSPFNLVKDIDVENPDVVGLLKGGVTLGGEHVGGLYQEGLVGRSLSRHVPGLGPLLESYHSWLFQDFIPRMKMTMALKALERNRGRFKTDLDSGRMTEDALFYQTAKEANAAFGELNYVMLERSKTAQDLARLILLAPDFLEARSRFALQAGTKLGGEQRMALLLGALTLYATARIFNKAIDDRWHFEPENAFSVVHNGHAYSLRTVQGDILHALESPVRFWLHRLNPTLTRPLFELITQRDEFGRKRDFWQVMGDTISNLIPISLRNNREQKLWESLLNSFGFSERRYNDTKRTYELAVDWKKKNKVGQEPGEFIYDADKDIYRGTKLALLDGDAAAAAVEIKKLMDSNRATRQQIIEHFNRYATAPFTGAAKHERKFVESLGADQKKTYEAARQEKLRMGQKFREALRILNRDMAKPDGALPQF